MNAPARVSLHAEEVVAGGDPAVLRVGGAEDRVSTRRYAAVAADHREQVAIVERAFELERHVHDRLAEPARLLDGAEVALGQVDIPRVGGWIGILEAERHIQAVDRSGRRLTDPRRVREAFRLRP